MKNIFFNNYIESFFASKLAQSISAILILYFSSQLLNTDAYYMPYLLISILFFLSFAYNNKVGTDKNIIFKNHFFTVIILTFSILFSCMITLSNYNLWHFSMFSTSIWNIPYRLYKFLLLCAFFTGGFIGFLNTFLTLSIKRNSLAWQRNNNRNKLSAKLAFFLSFISITIINCFILFSCHYPGNLTPDSLIQISQILSGQYSNHHPFYHTQIIRLCYIIGMRIFNDINASIALYSICQILFMAICFSFSASTLSHLKISIKIQLAIMAFYILLPYHIVYSMTMWKDVMFGGFVLLLIIFTFRCIYFIGNTKTNYIILIFSGIGTCLFRSNGFVSFILLVIAFLLIFRKKHKKLLLSFLFILITSFFLKYPVLNYLNVTQPDQIESLSIPAQQVARVIVEGKNLTDTEINLFSQIVDIEKIPERYTPYISDNIKNLIREKGAQDYLEKNKIDFLKAYLSLGIRYPGSYIRAWVDETKGYWNSGYDYWIWSTNIQDNSLGIKRTLLSENVKNFFDQYLNIFNDIQLLKPLLCIGLFVWIDLIMLFISLLRKDRLGIYFTLPIISIVFSLLIATPVYSEFRYIYAAFCSLPMIIIIVLRPLSKNTA